MGTRSGIERAGGRLCFLGGAGRFSGKGLEPLPLISGYVKETQADVELISSCRGSSIIPEHLGLKGEGFLSGSGFQMQKQGRISLLIAVQKEVMTFNQGVVGLKAGPLTGDIGESPSHFAGARLLLRTIPHLELHINSRRVSGESLALEAKIFPQSHTTHHRRFKKL